MSGRNFEHCQHTIYSKAPDMRPSLHLHDLSSATGHDDTAGLLEKCIEVPPLGRGRFGIIVQSAMC